MGVIEKAGGRKFLLALVIVLVVLAVLIIAAIKGKLDTGLAGILVGAVTWVATQFGLTNVANTKAALAANGAKNEEAARLDGMSPVGVLKLAGERTGADISGAVDDAITAGQSHFATRAGAILQGTGSVDTPDSGRGDPHDIGGSGC